MNKWSVYLHINNKNGKMYCGITSMNPPKKRWGKEGNKYSRHPHFWSAIQKYGWNNFEHKIIAKNLSEEEACEKEKELIEKYNLTNPEKGYNTFKGGKINTEEIKEKMSKAHKNKTLTEEHKKAISRSLGKGENNVNFGRKQSKEAVLHNSLAKRGNKHPNYGKHLKENTKEKIKEKVSKPIIQCDLEGNVIKEWESGKQAALELNLGYKAINNCLRGLRKSSFGYKWYYINK